MKFLILSIVCVILVFPYPTNAQQIVLEGPILVTQVERNIVFQDVGTGRVWQFALSSGQLRYFNPWTPDGCAVVIEYPSYSIDERPTYALLSIASGTISDLTGFGNPLWSPDGEVIAFGIYDFELEIVNVYLVNDINEAPEQIFSVPPRSGLQWVSDHELVYVEDGLSFVWNRITRETTRFGSDLYPPDGYPTDIPTEHLYTISQFSPDRTMRVGYSHPMSYLDQWTGNDIPTTPEPEILAELREGIDIYFLNTGEIRHVDIDHYILSVNWSPISQMLVIEPYYRGSNDGYFLYTYDVTNDVLTQLNLDAWRAVFGSINTPVWSPDEQWLAIQSEDGPLIYNLRSEEIVALDQQFWGARLYTSGATLRWSPVMSYENQCN